VAVIALVVLVAGAVGTYVWALGHWFVGVDGSGDTEQVAIFRGLDVSVLGFDFYEVDEDTGLALTDLTPAAQNRVRGGITADDSGDADRILTALREQRLPVCRAAAATPTARPTPTRPTTPAVPTDPGVVVPPTGAAPTTTPSSSTATRTTAEPEPGVDCRETD
jgi:protein phosphatase